jgi:transcriptional antiterminator
LHKKHDQLVNFLLKQNGEYVSASILSEILEVTNRTIRNYVNDINHVHDDITISSSPQGYAIISDSINIQQEREVSNEKEIEEAILDFKIIQILINKKDYTTYDAIADNLFFSSQTIRRRIQNLSIDIKNSDVNVFIDTKVFVGIKLVGTEIQKRILLESFFTTIAMKKERYRDYIVNVFSSWVDEQLINNVFKSVDKINTQYSLNLEFQMYKKIIVQLIIIIHQINHHALVNINDVSLSDLKKFKEYDVMEAFRSKLFGDNGMPDVEAVFLVNYLMSLQLDLGESTIVKNKTTKDIEVIKRIRNILLQAEQSYGVPIHSKRSFRDNISNHIYRMIYPTSYNFIIYNPFVKETKSEYFFSFSIASEIALQIEKDFYVEIQDSEIAYLAYHIQLIFDSQDKHKTSTIVLYSRNYERSKLLASKIATYFDDIEICGIEKYSDSYSFDQSYLYIAVDLIHFPQDNENFLAIKSSFQSDDIKKIKIFLEAQYSVIELASIHWINENTLDKAIETLLKINNKLSFYEPIMQRERMSYTAVGNLIAIPHPYFEKNKYKEQVIIGINNKTITWGNELVQLIIIYIPSSDIERNEYVFNEFYQKTRSISSVKELVHSSNRDDFINIWNHI